MKNLVNIKDAFFRGVRHCGKAMLLLVALTALSGSAWADDKPTVYIYTTDDLSSTTLNLWAWDTSTLKNYSGGTWPGQAFTATSVSNWYKYELINDATMSTNYKAIVSKNGGSQSGENDLDNRTGNTVAWYSNGGAGVYDTSSLRFWGSWDSWAAGKAVTGFDGDKMACYYTMTLPAGDYEFRPKWGDADSDWKTPVAANDRGNKDITISGNNATFTLDKTYDVTFYVDPGQKSEGVHYVFINVEAKITSTPTVLISKSEKVEGQEVTLSGYLKYTGCKNINNVGFIISQDEEEVEDGTAQVYNATTAPDAPIAAMSDFNLLSDEFENNVTYYYKAWMKASDETVTLSEETRSFTPAGECNITDAASVLPIFESGKITESATFTEGSASINLKVDKNSIADVYQWNVEDQPTGGNATFSTGAKRNTSVTVSAVGTYTFTLSAKCTDDAQLIESSRVLTLYVCEPAEATQLYLDNHTVNVLCAGEKATATCITKEGYTYSLYSPSGDNLGSLAGTGGTQTWRNVTGAGEFTMRTSPTTLPQCAAVVSSAVQRYNEPLLEITADPGLSVLSYQPVILSKKDVESPTYVDTDPTWVITNGSDKAYLLNEHNRLAYDNRARESVVFKAGAGIATQITIEASAYKTMEVEDSEAGDYTKQCPATVDVTLTVSPAEDDCDN